MATAGTTNATTTFYGYDRNGAQTHKRVGAAGAVEVNEWQFDGTLAETKTQGAATGGSEFIYDAAGNRLKQKTAIGKPEAKEVRYLVDPNTSYAQVVQERDEQNVLQARYAWEDGLAPLVMWRRTKTGAYAAFFYLCDGQDSVRQLSDASGRVTDSYFYDAFGNALQGGSGDTPNPFRYTGQQLDPSGNYYLRARYYNSGSGRFLSHDPLMGGSDDPISMHRYLYAANDGVNFVDPSGEETLAGALTSIGVGTTLASVLSVSLTAGSWIATTVSVANLISDYEATGTVDPIDLGLTVASIAAPGITRLAASFLSRAGIAFSNLLRSGAFDKFVIQKVGDVWMKSVNPRAFKLVQSIARSDLNRQVKALDQLGDMAPNFTANLDDGILLIKDVGTFGGTRWEAFKIWWKGSARMRNWLNDIRPHNIGANGQIFDPALPAYQQLAYGAGAGGLSAGAAATGYYMWLNHSNEED